MLVPDMAQERVFMRSVEKSLKERRDACLSLTAFNVHFKQIKPRKDLDVVLIAPKGPGDLVRRQYQQGRGVPCLIAVARMQPARPTRRRFLRSAASAARAAVVLDTTFSEETETDLFGESCVVRRRNRARGEGFETLVEAGYSPRSPTNECMHELKLDRACSTKRLHE